MGAAVESDVRERDRSILVVDDEHEVSALLEEFLGCQGFEVSAVTEATSGRRMLVERDWDAAIFDLAIHRESGLDLLRDARAIRPGLGIVIITAHASPNTVAEARGLGASGYLLKPFHLREVLAEVHTAVRRTLLARSRRRIEFVLRRAAGFGDRTLSPRVRA